MERKYLFRMTLKRKLKLSDIITTVNLRLDHVTGYARLLLEHIPDENERIKREKENFEEERKLILVHDVLETVVCHEVDYKLDLFMKEKRTWRNEWDIPDELFKKAIDDAIELFQWYGERTTEKYRKNHEKRIEFLKELASFRLKEKQ